MEWGGTGEELPILFLVHFSWQVCPTLWATGLEVPHQMVQGRRTGGHCFWTWRAPLHMQNPHVDISYWTDLEGLKQEGKKKKPLNGNLTAENESISKLFTPFSPLPTSSAKPAASGTDLFHSWFSQSLGGHWVLICSHYRKWKLIWRVGRWCAKWLERYTPWRLPSH